MNWMHIGPNKALDLTKDRTHYMILPDPLQRYGDYYNFYMQQSWRDDTFVMLDNGAFENSGTPLDPQRLLGLASLIKADEIVIPDRMGDADTTMSMVQDYLETYSLQNYKLAAVVTGRDAKSAWDMAEELIDTFGDRLSTVCLPKLLVEYQPDLRQKLAFRIHELHPELYVHFLGINIKNPFDFGPVQPFVRSCDTSLAFLAGIRKIQLDWTLDVRNMAASRPENFWTRHIDIEQERCILHNMRVMEGWLVG